MPDPSQPELDQAFHEYLKLVDQQESVDPAEFIQRYPELAEPLSQLIETATAVERMAGPRLSETTAESAIADTVSDETVIGRHSLTNVNSISAESLSGVSVGDYELLEELGRGGMGVVYRARQTEMDRDVAFKMIRSGCLASENDVQRFYLEARAAGRLKHPSIVPVYQVGEIDGHHYFSMEYIAGEDLAEYAKREDLSPQQIAGLLRQVAEATDYAHQQGVLHRDLKPSNILVDADGTPRITDFGLAKDMESSEDLTSSGSTVGTPSYMPPEQAQALRDDISCRSDVYSLGAILYSLLTGQPPFRTDSILDTMLAVVHSDPVPPSQLSAGCSPDLEAICLKCLQKDPEDRYATARELAEDLDRFARGESVTARRSRIDRRVWRWLRKVPLIAAALGRKSIRPTPWHIRSQWIAIISLVVFCGGILLFPMLSESSRLRTVDIGTGDEEGYYAAIGPVLAEALAARSQRTVQAQHSAGADESHVKLRTGEIDIAFLQENVLGGDGIEVLAPLYYEPTLVLVRSNLGLSKMADLAGHRIALGEVGSGMRHSSLRVLEHYQLTEDQIEDNEHDFHALITDDTLDGAIITIKMDARKLFDVLQSDTFHLLPLASNIPGFHPIEINKEDLPQLTTPNGLEVTGLFVPSTLAILAVRAQSPDWFVDDCLSALYEDGVSNQFEDIFPREEAAALGIRDYHSAARVYFATVGDDAQQQ